MKKIAKILSILLTAAMLLSLCAFASGEASGEASAEAGGEASAEASDEAGSEASGETGGSASGEASGNGSGGLDLSGLLALKQYVFVSSQGEIADGTVSTDCYGVYTAGGEGEAAFVPTAFDGDITVYADSGLTVSAAPAAAFAADGVLTVTGVDTEGNTAYYLSTGDGAYTTIIYVVNDEYEDNATLTLADGTTMELTTFAPNMHFGDYTAAVGQNAIEGETSFFIGGNRTARTLDDFTDPENFAGYETEAAWYIRSGITNSGDSLTTFGSTMYKYQYLVAMYRLFQIVIDTNTFAAGYTDPDDFAAGMGSNDGYSDSLTATMQAGVWNGIYTQYADVKDVGEGYWLLRGIDGVTSLGTGEVLDVEFAYVGLFNAFQSVWTMLNEDGLAMADALAAYAADYDGASAEPPADFSNEAKIAAVSAVLLGEDEIPAGDRQFTKAEAVAVLYAARGYIQSKTPPDAARAEYTGSSYTDMTQWFGPDYGDTVIVTKDNLAEVQAASGELDLISERNAAMLVDNAGELTILNNTISLTGSSDDAAAVVTTMTDPRYAIDGPEAASDPTHEGFVYNAAARNAVYRYSLGTALAAWGADTIVNLRSDDGTLVFDGEASSSLPMGTMAGTVEAIFGGTINITNGVAYSAGQHLTNILYNGSIHYVDSLAIGSGRLYSSDFWGGYQVYEDSVTRGGNVTDEPSTLIVKNCVYGTTAGGFGLASQYYENSILNIGTVAFYDHTSLITDSGAFTAVNCVVNSSGSTFASSSKGERAIITLVDSSVTFSGSELASVKNRTSASVTDKTVDPDEYDAFMALFDGQMAFCFYGDVTLDTADGTLTANVEEGSILYIYSANLTEDDITNTGDGTIVFITDPAYGTVTVQ